MVGLGRNVSDILRLVYFESFFRNYYCIKLCCDVGRVYESKLLPKTSLRAVFLCNDKRLYLTRVQLINKADNNCSAFETHRQHLQVL